MLRTAPFLCFLAIACQPAPTANDETLLLRGRALREAIVGAAWLDDNLITSFCADGNARISGTRASMSRLYTIEDDKLCFGPNECLHVYRRGDSFLMQRREDGQLEEMNLQRQSGC